MGKKVRLMVELDNEFISLLRANLTMKGTLRGGAEDEPLAASAMDVLHVLGLVVLGEAMGAYPGQTWQKIPPIWRPHISMVADKREVIPQ